MNFMITRMGDEADDILRSFKLSEEDKKKKEVLGSKGQV